MKTGTRIPSRTPTVPAGKGGSVRAGNDTWGGSLAARGVHLGEYVQCLLVEHQICSAKILLQML